jgi:O-antigen ligase
VDNFWLHLQVEVGLLGTLLFGAALALAGWGAIANARDSSGWRRVVCGAAAATAIVIAVDSVTEMLLEGNTTSFATWFFLGVASTLAIGVTPGGGDGPADGTAADAAAGPRA